MAKAELLTNEAAKHGVIVTSMTGGFRVSKGNYFSAISTSRLLKMTTEQIARFAHLTALEADTAEHWDA